MRLETVKLKTAFSPFVHSADLGKRILEASRTSETSKGKVYKGVTIIKAGLGNMRDKNFYPNKALKEATDKGMFEGLRAYIDHPDAVSEEILPERTIRDLAGIYTNSRFKESNGVGRVIADFRVFKHQNWLSSLVDDLLEAGQADKIGISVNGSGKTRPEKMRLQEAGPDPIDVNYVESFVGLRSADVVTSAGAGGGWSKLKEAAREAKREHKTMRLTQEQLAELQEAAENGDMAAVKKLAAALKNQSDDDDTEDVREARGKKGGKGFMKKGGKKGASADGKDMEESEEEPEDGEEQEEDESEEELDAAVEEAKEGTDEEDLDDEDDLDEDEDVEESDEEYDPDATGDDLEDVEESDEEDDEESSRSKKIRAAVKKQKAAREAGRGPNYQASGKMGTGTKPQAQQRKKQGGRGFPSSAGKMGISTSKESAILARKNDRLLEANARLKAALRVRSTADRARKLLRESDIPAKLQPDILPLLVGQTEDEMKRRIRYHERLVTHVISEVGGGEEYESVSGNGSRIREGGYGENGGDMNDVFREVGLPTIDDDTDE